MFIRTIFVITIFSNIAIYTGAYSNIQLIDNLLKLKMENIGNNCINKFYNLCMHAAFIYISNGYYKHDKDKFPENQSEHCCLPILNDVMNKSCDYSKRFKTKKYRINEVHILMFRLQRVFDHGQVSPEGFKFYKRVRTFFRHFTSWANDPTDAEEKKVQGMAMRFIDDAITNHLSRQDIYPSEDRLQEFFNTYHNCIITFDSLSKPTESIESQLHELYMEDKPNCPGVHKHDTYLQKMFLSPLDTYGNILPLLNTEQSEEFLALNPQEQKIFIVDIMFRALVNAFDVINTCFNKLKNYKFTMKSVENIRDKSILELNRYYKDYVKLKIFMILYKDAINTIEAVHNIPEISSEAKQGFDEDYSIFTKTFHAKWTKLCSDNNTDKSRATKKTFETGVKKKYNADKSRAAKKTFKTSVKKKYNGQLATYNDSENRYSIRVSMYGYYSFFIYDHPKIVRKKHGSFLTDNHDIQLLLDIRLWMMIIRKIAPIMVNDLYFNEIVLKEEPGWDYLSEIKGKIEEREKTQQFIKQQNIYKNDKVFIDR